MASPFRWFRKHQKAMLAVVTLLSMFAFVFLGSWSRFGEPGGKVVNPEVFTWKYGAVHERELRDRKEQRQLVAQFLLNAVAAASGPGIDPQQIQYALQQYFPLPLSNEAIEEAILLDKKAADLGIVISNTVVNDLIYGFTGNRLSKDQLADLISHMSYEQMRVTQTLLFDAMKMELAALRTKQILLQPYSRVAGQMATFRGDPPADRWDYYCRLNRKVTAQVLPIPVENFVAQVKDPSDADLRAFYDQYKDAYPDPQSPTPGFKQPFRAQFQYLKADYEKLVEEEKPKITDDEIKTHYAEFKDDFRKVELPPVKAGDQKTEKEGGEKASAEKSSADKSGKGGAKASDTKAGDAKSGTQKSDAKKTDDSKKATDRKQSSNTRPSLDGELLALADGAQREVAQATKAPTGGAKTAPSTKSDSKADAKKTDAKAADAKAADGKKADAKTTDGKTEADTKATETKPLEPTPIEYEPLEKVTDSIRLRLADKSLQTRLDNAFNAVRLKMDQYRRELAKYDSEVKRKITSGKAPPAPDFKALAAQFGLEFNQTDFVTVDQAEAGTDVGKSFQLSSGPANPQQFREIAFNESLTKYQPEQTEDLDRNRYLIWKTADEATRTPKLEEIRPEVARAWKMIEARKLAQAKAEEVAAQARQHNTALKDMVKDASAGEVITTKPFTWLSRSLSNPMAMPRLSEVEGLKDVGDEFMESAFALQTGQTAGGKNFHNRPQTVFYAVQLEGEEPSQAELQESFLASMDAPASAAIYAVVGALDRTGLAPEPTQWLTELKREFDFKRAAGSTPASTEPEEIN